MDHTAPMPERMRERLAKHQRLNAITARLSERGRADALIVSEGFYQKLTQRRPLSAGSCIRSERQ